MAPAAPPNLTPKERAARKAVLSRSIRLREAQVAKWKTFIRDDYLDRAIARLEREIGELQGQRKALDSLNPGAAAEVAAAYLGFQRYER